MIAFTIIAIAVLAMPMITHVTTGNAELTKIALNYADNNATANSIMDAMAFGLSAATTFGLLCGIQAIAVGVPWL